MPVVTVKFNLPEEKEEFKRSHEGSAYYSVIIDLLDYIRSETKYTDRETFTVDEIRGTIYDLLETKGVNIHGDY